MDIVLLGTKHNKCLDGQADALRLDLPVDMEEEILTKTRQTQMGARQTEATEETAEMEGMAETGVVTRGEDLTTAAAAKIREAVARRHRQRAEDHPKDADVRLEGNEHKKSVIKMQRSRGGRN